MAAPLAQAARCEPMTTWLRYDVDAVPVHPRLYASLAGTAAMLLHGRAADHVFFVHTPLGVRLRCRAGQPNTADVAWQAALAEARGRGWVTGWRPAPFEPEAFGLGGPDAMAAAHRVFTADSLAWLELHARAARPVPTVARWSASLLMIRALVNGLGLTPWQADDLWDRIGRNTRRLRHSDAVDPAVRHAKPPGSAPGPATGGGREAKADDPDDRRGAALPGSGQRRLQRAAAAGQGRVAEPAPAGRR